MACPGPSAFDPRCQLKDLANSAFEKMARSFASAAADASDWLWRQIDQATTINLDSPGLNKDLIATGGIAIVLCLGLFVIQVITGALRREPDALLRGVRGLGIATIASAFAIATTKISLAAVDQLSNGVVKYATGDSIDGLGSRFALSASLSQLTNPAGMLLFAIVVLVAVVIVWFAMMMRKLLIIVAAVMTPLAFAGGAADITRSWVRRWIEFTAALIASKLILVVMLMIGLSIFEGAGMQGTPAPGGGMQPASATQAGTQLATGAVLLLIAGFAPWIAIKMFHFAGDSLHAVHAQAGAARAGTQPIVAAPRKVSSTMATGRGVSGGSATGSGGTTTAMPTVLRTNANGTALRGHSPGVGGANGVGRTPSRGAVASANGASATGAATNGAVGAVAAGASAAKGSVDTATNAVQRATPSEPSSTPPRNLPRPSERIGE